MVETKQKAVRHIGEQIHLELAGKMIKDYRDEFPEDVSEFRIGKKILMAILRQPGCEGLSLVLAKDESGNKTLVYVGVDKHHQHILEVTFVNKKGKMITKPGIVADRSTGTWPTTKPGWHWDQK